MTDIHCHILPGVDDGSDSLQESLMMAERAAACGTETIIATPHFGEHNEPEDLVLITRAYRQLREALHRENIPLRLYLGCELFASPDILPALERHEIPTLNGTDYLLMEFDFEIEKQSAERLLSAIAGMGYIPVIAHVERYRFVQRNPETLLRWVARGFVVQLNKGSFFGAFGRGAAEIAHYAVETGCVHIVASDAHSPYRRTTNMADAEEYISETWLPEIAELLLEENPAAICRGRKPASVLEKFPIIGEEL